MPELGKTPGKSMKTAFIRVHLHNETEEGPVDYTYEDLENKTIDLKCRYSGTQYAIILHNKDIDPVTKEPKKEHVHIVFTFKHPVVFKYVKEQFPYGSIKTCKSVNACIQYLIHKNDPDKTQYELKDIETNFSDTQIEEYMLTTDSGAAMSRLAVDRLIERIDNGEIREYNIHTFVDPVTLARNDSVFSRAFKNYYAKLDKHRTLNVYFITGATGSGKTAVAKMMAEKLDDGSYCMSSSSNDPVQDYKGENTLIFDDLRDTDFEKMQDLLKIIDPYTSSSVKARYRNKIFAGKNIIITSEKPLDKWYAHDTENLGQLKRRIGEMVEVTKDKLITYRPVRKGNTYVMERIGSGPNPVWDYIEAHHKEHHTPCIFDIISPGVEYQLDALPY
jgi:hypothetical protein